MTWTDGMLYPLLHRLELLAEGAQLSLHEAVALLFDDPAVAPSG
jgi:hypothetical protein